MNLFRFTCALSLASLASTVSAEAPADPLRFDGQHYTQKTVKVGDREVRYRAYEGIVYVAKPVNATYQSLNFYVPEDYFEGKTIDGFTLTTAPVFLPNTVGGYMPGKPGRVEGDASFGPPPGALPPRGEPPAGSPPFSGAPKVSTLAVALSKGFVVAAPGARGRTLKNAEGVWYGKAPACIVDLKAAVRYLRHNDSLMAGDANRIISNGTSAGGALSALLGASGNSIDYEPYLKEIGAAAERDDIFAASCYCPITNLDHADAAYEWLFNGVTTYRNRGQNGSLTARQLEASAKLKQSFPEYVNKLGLRNTQGTLLTLAPDGSGTFADEVKAALGASAEAAFRKGIQIPTTTGITLEDGRAVAVDLRTYAAAVGRMKTAPAFDGLALETGENSLFGTASNDYAHFTAWGAAYGDPGASADPTLVALLNPLTFLGKARVQTSPHWRIRHGTSDRDTSLAIPIILATRLRNTGADVDFSLPWGVPHSGDYDLDELFAWAAKIVRE